MTDTSTEGNQAVSRNGTVFRKDQNSKCIVLFQAINRLLDQEICQYLTWQC
ncbi:hypothetical protein RB213_002726 [Colletotrichum asianum]